MFRVHPSAAAHTATQRKLPHARAARSCLCAPTKASYTQCTPRAIASSVHRAAHCCRLTMLCYPVLCYVGTASAGTGCRSSRRRRTTVSSSGLQNCSVSGIQHRCVGCSTLGAPVWDSLVLITAHTKAWVQASTSLQRQLPWPTLVNPTDSVRKRPMHARLPAIACMHRAGSC